ncbi:Serine/Threonine kinase domain protein (macronuclear) [Tetrahymena thermophila SB210]|uniref:non-specific serine/threonine protein kinase n=1 Tax=Tetrahymena thermophila (strain SB210) TaxID=312017 RepID=I7LVK5_TETTS|nr:Serine/Threonine kinase domain protein [Tetrahymena thermophila SB210]EAR98405.2 Serine/Threonine kinase domain protein [Tetrahymena thermophila SB210]|eukprot:XP_001018650.2 Serine/Threonine kinase domain protein [Tetrahymena thermophila SB210]
MIGTAIFDDNFSEDKLTLIARGGFSQIFVTQCNLTKQPIVVKKMKSDDPSTLNFLTQEANCIKKLNDENPNIKNIIKIYSNHQRGNCIYIAMEYCPLGSLEKILQQKQKLSHYEILIFAKQMISALIYAHRLGLVHSDLKPENVLIREQNEYVLTDWGSAQQLNHQHSTTLRDNTYFTPGYQAPELQNENLISSNMKFNYFIADIYSLGMMLLRCTGPTFREIRTISSEADQGDHDWKINKLFKTYIYQKEYQDGVIDKIIAGFLNYSKSSRMKLEEALKTINTTYPNLEDQENIKENFDSQIQEEYHNIQDCSKYNFLANCDQIEESLNLSQLKISTQERSNQSQSQQYNQNTITIPKKNYSSYRNQISSFNQNLVFSNEQVSQSVGKQMQYQKPLQKSNQSEANQQNVLSNQTNSFQQQRFSQPDFKSSKSIFVESSEQAQQIQQMHKNIEEMSSSNDISSSNSSGNGSNQSSKKVDKVESGDLKDSSRQKIREIKRNKSQDKLRINKNISITYLNELIKLNPEVDNFKAYLSNQINDENVSQLSQKLNELVNIKKLFLAIGGNTNFTDNSIFAIQNALENKKNLQEISFDVSNSQKVSLSAINHFLQGIYSKNLESISLSLSRIQISDTDFDDLVSFLFDLKNLKRLSISLSQCQQITEDDIDFICEQAEDYDQLNSFYLICPRNVIQDDKAFQIENRLSNQISDVKITISS